MGSIGDLTPPAALTATVEGEVLLEPETFDLYGHTFVLPERVGPAAQMRFNALLLDADRLSQRADQLRRSGGPDAAHRAQRLGIEAEMKSSAASYGLIRSTLGVDQADQILDLLDVHGATLADVFAVVHRVQEAIAARPTRRSSGSAGGPSNTGTSYTDGGSPPVETPTTSGTSYGETPQAQVSTGAAPTNVTPLTPREQQRENLAEVLTPVAAVGASYG